MLSTDAAFPWPGSRAIFEGEHWRVLRLNGDGTATVYRDGTRPGSRASLHRTVEVADLVDPGGRIARRPDAPLAIRLAAALKTLDAVYLTDAIDRAQILIGQHRLPFRATPALVRSILEDLGWHRDEAERSRILYRRDVETLVNAATAPRQRRRAA